MKNFTTDCVECIGRKVLRKVENRKKGIKRRKGKKEGITNRRGGSTFCGPHSRSI